MAALVVLPPAAAVSSASIFQTLQLDVNVSSNARVSVIRPLVRSISAGTGVYDVVPATNLGTGIRVYVVDTGIRAAHQEFRQYPGIDGTTRVVPIFDAILTGPDGGDCSGHGTHVTGLAGGLTKGVARNVTLLSVRVLDCDGYGTISSILSGLNWIYELGETPAIISISVGTSTVNGILDNAINRLYDKGFLVVVAAGNDAVDACSESLASSSDALAVGAVDKDHRVKAFSNFGACVDLFATGVNLNSSFNLADDAYKVLSGTSMATPLISGHLAAIMEERLALAKRADAKNIFLELLHEAIVSPLNITYLA